MAVTDVPSGFMARQAFDQARDLHRLQMAEGQLKLGQEAVDLESAQITLQSQVKMKELMNTYSRKQDETQSVGVPGVPGSQGATAPITPHTDPLAKRLRDIAGMYSESGQPEAAVKASQQASDIEKNDAYIDSVRAQQDVKDIQIVSNMMQGVTDQASWEAANAGAEMMTGHPSPYKGKPYDPNTVKMLQGALLTAKQKADVKYREAQIRSQDALVKEREAQARFANARAKAAKEKDGAHRKNGSVTLIPKAADVNMIGDMIAAKYPEAGSDSHVLRNLARPTADRMLALMNDEGLTKSEAAARAFAEADHAGDFAPFKENTHNKGAFKNPLPMPQTKDGLRANHFYLATKGKLAGQILLWDGKAFSLPPAEQPAGEEDDGNPADDEQAVE